MTTSEDELIASLVKLLPRGSHTVVPSGDDCAVYRLANNLCASVDVLVEDVHFKSAWSTARQIGQRAAAQNLADAVAMGATPVSLLVSITVPADKDSAWLQDFAAGLADRCRPWNCGVDGGDLSKGALLTISVTVLGEQIGEEPILRSGARPGDQVVVAGQLGFSYLGLRLAQLGIRPACAALLTDELLEHRHLQQLKTLLPGLDSALYGLLREPSVWKALEIYAAPQPPLAAVLAARKHLKALMDISDGLLLDASRQARASEVEYKLDAAACMRAFSPELLPIAELIVYLENHPGERAKITALLDALLVKAGFVVAKVATTAQNSVVSPNETKQNSADLPLDSTQQLAKAREIVKKAILSGGEDHAFLGAAVDSWQLPTGFVKIGTVVPLAPGSQGHAYLEDDESEDKNTWQDAGWDHFKLKN